MERGTDIEATIRDLRHLIHAALLREADWLEFLQRLQLLLPRGAATLFYHDAVGGRGAFSLCAGLEADALQDYANHYCTLNPWMEAAARRPIGLAVPDAAMLPREKLAQTAFFNDFMRPQGLRGAVGITVARESSSNFMLSILGDTEDTAERQDALAVLSALVLDLRRAFAFYRRATSVASWSATGEELAIVVVGCGRRVRSATTAALARLEEDAGCLGPTGRLDLRDARATEDIDWRLAGACRADFDPPPSVFLTARPGRTPAKLTVFTPAWDGGSRFFRGPECVLVIEAPCDAPLDLAEVARFFNLTDAEARVAAGVAAGCTLREISSEGGVAYETVRTQLAGVFAKTGARRQAELARLLQALSG